MSDNGDYRLITSSNARSPFAEAFRTLRTNINFAGLDNPYRTILVTSAGPDEGKTTTIANLGIVMAQSNKKVLIIGLDLRRPNLHKVFNIEDKVGVTNALIENIDPRDIAQEAEIPGLYILPSGPIPPNPSELIASQRMHVLLERASKNFDLVLVDSPPLMLSDALLLANQVDGVILVVSKGTTRKDHAKDAKEKLERVGAKVIGVVLNRVDMEGGDYYYYYYYAHDGGSKRRRQKPGKIASF